MNEAATLTPERTDSAIKIRLYGMMFLQYFVQGCYLPIISVYLQNTLGFNSTQIGLFMSALAVGPLLAPFILGQIVDRYLSTERVLSFCHFTAGILMLALYRQTAVVPALVLGMLYSVLYVPTLMLTNALAFHHLRRRDREFPLVRVWGTIGFVVPAWLIELILLRGLEGQALNQARGVALLLSGAVEIAFAIYCLTLPHTPPQPQQGKGRFAPGVVVGLLRRPDMLVLVLVGLFVGIGHSFYFFWSSPYLRWFLDRGGIREAMEQRISSLGQISEIAVMAGLGLALVRIGFKRTLAIGVTAYMLRCLIFAGVPFMTGPYGLEMFLVCLGQALHGFCFGCFWAAGFIYVDRVAPHDVRGSMQTFFGTFVFGLGTFIGGFFGGGVGNLFSTGSGTDVVRNWSGIWFICAVMLGITLAAFWLFFPSRVSEREEGKP